MAAVGQRQIEMLALVGKVFDPIRREVGHRDQCGQHRRKIAPLAVNFDPERQLKSVEAARFELCVEFT